ncbi:hypothetical protein BKA14_007714 [Actinoplanes abujensis]|uniref:GNAT acetyltransferase-like protein n=1 Tax=Paractinoplanes abujensis TaxID=882441 RepID=A0A7W7D2F2_9ACTN|nr:GNAT family N-acetyltransferase [Actinoplanes abujensis]MBB4697566.1 hypothetical protein [Actinoplanes abujensis]
MTDGSLMRRVRSLWVELAGVPASGSEDKDVIVSPRSRLCPPGWCGIVDLGSVAIVTAPDARSAAALRPALSTADWLTRLPVAEVLGPATLLYCDGESFRPASGPADFVRGVDEATADQVVALPAAHPDVVALRAGVSADEDGEAGLADITSQAFVVRGKAAAGYEVWPRATAHLSVLTAIEWRGRGLARLVASAATADALSKGLMPQWRARPEASRRVARGLGFREFGTQLSIRLGPVS